MKHLSCNELGVCNQRPGPGCTCRLDRQRYPFAPGVIEASRRTGALRRLLRHLLALFNIH